MASLQYLANGNAPVTPTLRIHADIKPRLLDLRELWAYREVLYALVWREVKVRYAQTVAGVGWALLQPVLTTVVLTVLAGRWMGVRSGGVPYSLLALSGLVPWIYFTHVLTKSSLCLLNTGLLSKAYFPRLLMPLSSVFGGLIDLSVAGAILVILMVYFREVPGPAILLLPVSLLLLLASAIGAALWLSALNLYNRDISHALPFATQLLFFMTPVAYPISLVPQKWRLLCSLNPMLGVIEAFRWSLFGKSAGVSLPDLAVSALSAALILLTGLRYFGGRQATFADVGES